MRFVDGFSAGELGLDQRSGRWSLGAEAVGLSDLVTVIVRPTQNHIPDLRIHAISCNAEILEPGDVFVALPGRAPGSVDRAIARGASVVITDRTSQRELAVPTFYVHDARRALSHLLERMYGRPSTALSVVATMGTFAAGPTSRLLLAAASTAESKAARLSSRRLLESNLPSQLAHLRTDGCSTCVLPVTPRDVAEGRLDGVRVRVAVATRLFPHTCGSFRRTADYVDAASDLYRRLTRESVAVLDRSDPFSEILAEETSAQILTYGFDSEADIYGQITRADLNGLELDVRTPAGRVRLASKLIALPQASRLLAALAGACALGIDPVDAAARLSSIESIASVLERVPVPSDVAVFVDRASTNASLAHALKALRPFVGRDLWLVFGSSHGNAAARFQLGRVAERGADHVIVTTPPLSGSEHPMTSVRDLMCGFVEPREVLIEPTRAHAVAMALELARPKDVVLIAGGGRATGQDRTLVTQWFLRGLEQAASA